jgi:hypothetical protein
MAILKTHPREELIRFLGGELAGADKLRVEEHLQTCGDCHEFLSFAKDFNEGLSELGREEFVSKERCPESWTLACLEEGQLDDETARHVRAHLLFCDECAEMYYALRRTRGPGWARIILRAIGGILQCVSITGSGELLQPVPVTARLSREPAAPAGNVCIGAAARDPETGTTTTIRLRVEANPNRPEATIVLEAEPLQRGWKASLLDAQEQELTSVPLVHEQTTIGSGLPYGFYALNLYKGATRLASIELDIRATGLS